MPIINPGDNAGTESRDLFTWRGGTASVWGLGDDFDPNPYQPYDLSMGIATGDMVRIEGDGALVWFDGWNSGFARMDGERLDMTGIERVYTTAGNDTIRAGQATSPDGWQGISIFAGAGDDDINGSGFDDVIDGGSGNDTIRAGAGNDFVNSSTGDDLIYGGAGDENIRWGIGDAHWHDPGNDTIYGGEGRDLINVWVKDGDFDGTGNVAGGHVTITATRQWGDFQGTAEVGNGSGVSILRFQGFEQGWTHEGDDTIDGSAARVWGDVGIHWNTRWGDDLITGTAGNDTLEGGDGSDTIEGGEGDDLISANGDFFRLDAPGDGDADTIIFAAGDGHDTVIGFDAGLDTVQIAGGEFQAVSTADGTLLTLNSGDTLLLAGIFDFEV
ncbi:calcium-binding protein [Paracoccus sp. DMF]|uniref:calcium-binding protein n=1 Tax=Paracoccus sp. DMF TaxID=400837 RepID=UPI0011005DEE|nr:hypothetical protein [Paracoccus sp. DMF]MCV2448902.1 hypothetical protein [Paracoccus sp. DMF]